MSLSRADVLKHLSDLGYHDVSDELLEVFVQDLNQYVLNESTRENSSVTNSSVTSECSSVGGRKRITRHQNGNTTVTERGGESPRVTFDVSNSMSASSTHSLNTTESSRVLRPSYTENVQVTGCIIPRPVTAKKSDPVKRWKEYGVTWDHHKVPGEKRHAALRSAVRRQMAQCDLEPFVAPQRDIYVNNYQVPTDKKRQSLRWSVRTKMMS